jgi:apolipoprotein N-acyltransferase
MLKRFFALLRARPGLTAIIAGAASATGFAPLGLWPVTLIMLALLLWLLEHAPGHRAAFALGWLFGVGHFTIGNNWIATAFTFQAKMPAWLGWLAVPLLSLYLAIFIGLATWAAWAVWQRVTTPRQPGETRRPYILALLFAAAWIVTEWMRSWVFSGFAWNPLSAILLAHGDPNFLTRTMLSWLGTYGSSGVILYLGATYFGTFIPGPTQPEPQPYPSAKAQLAMQLTVGVLIAVALFLPQFLPDEDRAPRTTDTPFTIVQPNIGQGDKYDMQLRAENYAKLAALSPRQPDQPPRLLLWPEAAVPDYLEEGYPLEWYIEAPAFVRAQLAGLLGGEDMLVTGAVKLDPTPDGRDVAYARNSVFTMDAMGRLGPRYDKAHLVPYGEYLPMRMILEPLGISRLVPGAIDFRHGPGARTLDLGRFGQMGVQVCYEIIFSGQVVDRANRPDFIFNPSNDAWFGSWGPPQHLAQARLRAIEEGLPVIRATPTGISAVIDADGRIVDSIPMGVAGRIDGLVPAARSPTPFARFGNILPLGLALLLAISAVALARRRG